MGQDKTGHNRMEKVKTGRSGNKMLEWVLEGVLVEFMSGCMRAC